MDDIYREHGRMVYHYLQSLGADDFLAEELTQETFYQALKSIDRFRGESRLTTWLCGIAKNVFYAHLRNNPAPLELEESYPARAISWEAIETLKAIHRLAEPAREIVYLRLISDLSFRQIGEIMGQTETWARVNFYRAKQKLVEEIDGQT